MTKYKLDSLDSNVLEEILVALSCADGEDAYLDNELSTMLRFEARDVLKSRGVDTW